jgi:predicted nucleic acid-binding protein
MQLFFDTSAVVALVLKEAHSNAARETWSECDQAWAWDWMTVEAEAALTRRKANATAWQSWRVLSGQFNLVSLDPSSLEALCAFNRSLGLRAADAGHLFVHDRLLRTLPEAQLFTFDREQITSAQRLGLPIFE